MCFGGGTPQKKHGMFLVWGGQTVEWEETLKKSQVASDFFSHIAAMSSVKSETRRTKTMR